MRIVPVVPAPPCVVDRVIVNSDVPPGAMNAGENDFDTVTPLITCKVSDAAAPVPALLVVIGPVLLT